MLEKIQFLLSMQIIGLCILGGIMMLLRSFGNRARHILGWSMIMWALMAVIRNIVNFYLHEAKEAFHPDVLIASCFVVACLAAYVIEKLRPGYLTFKRFSIFLSPVLIGGFSYLTYPFIGWRDTCLLFDERCFCVFQSGRISSFTCFCTDCFLYGFAGLSGYEIRERIYGLS